MSLFFHRAKQLTHLLKSVEKHAVNSAVPVKNTCKDELIYGFLFFLETKSLTYLGRKDILVLNDKLGTKFIKKRYL